MGDVIQPLLILRPRPWKWLGVLAIGLVLAGGGWMMAHDPDDSSDQYLGWFCVVLFGIVVLVAIVQLIPGSSGVVVTAKGLYMTSMFKRHFIGWTEIEGFGVSERIQWHGPFRQRQRLVGLNFKAESEALRKVKRAAAFASAISGFHGALPDNYGYKHHELAEMLNDYLEASRRSA